MSQDEQFMRALASFQEPTGGMAAADVDICETYKKVRPILVAILPFIRLIPVFGSAAAKAIEALMAALDKLCGVSVAGFVGGPVGDADFLQAIAAFDPTLALTSTAAAPDICEIYKKVRPILLGLLPFIEAIPSIGKAIALAIRALMAALDSHCAG